MLELLLCKHNIALMLQAGILNHLPETISENWTRITDEYNRDSIFQVSKV